MVAMNSYDLATCHNMLSTDGKTLSHGEVHKVQAGLNLCKHDNDLGNISFWGRISGETADYYVAMSVKSQELDFFEFTFWVMGDDGKFTALADAGAHAAVVAAVQGPFTGNPATQLAEGEEGEEEFSGPTELHRLAHVVKTIHNECYVVPSNSYTIHQKQWVANANFSGLSRSSLGPLDVAAYEHFRAPTGLAQHTVAMSDDAQFQSHKLDDLFPGAWVLRETSTAKAVLRNMKYPGFIAFNDPYTSDFGACYLGDGQADPGCWFRRNIRSNPAEWQMGGAN